MQITKETNFLIIGLGLIGGSYAKALTKQGYQVKAITKEQSSIDFAVSNQIIQNGTTEINQQFIEEADFIIFALYPKTLIGWIKEHASLFSPNTLITDVTGIKEPIIEEIQQLLPEHVEFLASHPMAGKEVSGVENSDEQIFQKANFVITPNESNSEEAIATLTEFAKILGFENISCLTPKEHDDIIGFVSQLTHCLAIALMNSNSNERLQQYTGDSFRDLTRIAKINDEMWSELFLLNKHELLNHIECFEAELDKIKVALKDDDVSGLRKMMKQSTERRAIFDKEDKR